MRGLFGRRRAEPVPAEIDLGPYEGMEGRTGDIAGPWQFRRWDMSWRRPEYSYYRSVPTGIVNRSVTLDRTYHLLRPGPLTNIGQLLDVPMAALRSHPDAPEALPAEQEGLWISTNPAWPELSVNHALGKMGLSAVWEETSPDFRENYELVPTFVDGVDQDDSEPFDETPLSLTAPIIYVRPSELAIRAVSDLKHP